MEKDNSIVRLRKNVSLVVKPVIPPFVIMMASVAVTRVVSVVTVSMEVETIRINVV